MSEFDSAVPSEPELSSRKPSHAGPARVILVVDDDPLVREAVAGALEPRGYAVEHIANGREAIDRAEEGGVDLIVLDLHMPDLSGLDVCKVIKHSTEHSFLPILVITSSPDVESRVEALNCGADDCLSKPFDDRELLARIEAMLRTKLRYDQLAQSRAKLEQLSVHDPLTGVYNHRFLTLRLGDEFKRAERYHEPLACISADIDGLRRVNRIWGPSCGDDVIRAVADVMRASVREVDLVVRFGGDEFLVLLPNTHFAGSIAVAERILRDVAERELSGASDGLSVRLSIGIALYPSRDISDKALLLRRAEDALHQAKLDGGNRICVFQQEGHLYTPVLGPPISQGPTGAAERDESGTVKSGSAVGQSPDAESGSQLKEGGLETSAEASPKGRGRR